MWGWCLVIVCIILSWAISYGCGEANGERYGIDWMKRKAVGAGVAKACDFHSGWRFWTRDEIVSQAKYGLGQSAKALATTHRAGERGE